MSALKEKELNETKKIIKKWESSFFINHSKKPEKEDIHKADIEIKEAYKKYWNLKKEIDVTKSSVWSQKLNKLPVKQNLEKLNISIDVQHFCNKIKQHSAVKSSKKYKPLKSSHAANTSVSSEEFTKDQNIKVADCDFELAAPESEGVNPNSNDCVAKKSDAFEEDLQFFPTDTSVKFIKSSNPTKSIKKVNILSPSVVVSHSKKMLQFKPVLDEEWLNRCNESISKELENISNNTSSPARHEKVTRLASKTEGNSSLSTMNYDLDADKSSLSAVRPNFLGNESSSEVVVPAREFQTCDSGENGFIDRNTSEHLDMDSSSSAVVNAADVNVDCKEMCDDAEVRISRKRKLSSMQCSDYGDAKKSAHLKKKIAGGTLNENFVRVNIKKKMFVRGHKHVNVKKLKWQKWKQMKYGGTSTKKNITGCFRCGELGHWARNCTSIINKTDTSTLDEEEVLDDSPLPTLEEAKKLADEVKNKFNKSTAKQASSNPVSIQDTETPTKNENSEVLSKREIKPLFSTTSDGKLIATPKSVQNALKEMGYSNFKPGQEAAMMRVLSGLSTLLVLPTGSGKSLCYQLPAYMYAKENKSIVIVVSPLVSLMEDQVTGLPSCLKAVCLHSHTTEVQRSRALTEISEGSAQILLLSPEAIIGSFKLMQEILEMPPIAFVCIDEVHCISQWSHNFRPSYLQLYKVLTQKLGVKCILGLTATATQSTLRDVASHLGLQCTTDSVIGTTGIPDNLHLSISQDKDRDTALIKLLSGDRFSKCSSIIIYCIRRVETERLATLIRTCLQDEEQVKPKSKPTKKRQFAWTAEAYHAGLEPSRRRSVQKKFMSGRLRVVVATVAFGMGIDKADVRAIIHYNMPKNVESYVQEIGRAGRDRLPSQCHLFLDDKGHDLRELERHIYSDSTDRYVLRKLLKRLFKTCNCNLKETSQICVKHEVAFSINDTVQELDLKEENVSTLLCYLELHEKRWIEILAPTYATCTIRCYGGAQQMKQLALKDPIVSTAVSLSGKGLEKCSSFSFHMVDIASAVGWTTSNMRAHLKSLEWNSVAKRKSGVLVELSDLAFHAMAPGNLSDEELDEVLDFLHTKVVTLEDTALNNLKWLTAMFRKFSFSHYWECCDEVNEDSSKGIKKMVQAYFEDAPCQEFLDKGNETEQIDMCHVRSTVRDLICIHRDHTFSGRAVARICWGIGSPCYPVEVWGKVRKFWRCLLQVPFNDILKMANDEIRKQRG